jgi:hypothetical protein
MQVGVSSNTTFDAVKKAFEFNYRCMSIDGDIVGDPWNEDVGDYYN